MTRISELAREACIDLFATYGVDVEVAAAGESPDASWRCGLLGFSGDRARGSIVLVASPAILAGSSPLSDPHRDWVGELANQLVGRLKNHLLRYDVEISLGTPTVLGGHTVTPGAETECLWFDGPHGGVRLSLDVELDGELVEPIDLGPPGLLEGEMMLF